MDQDSIYRLLSALGVDKTKNLGSNILASCPMAHWTHKGNDKRPSFSISVNLGGASKWHCFGCGESANKTISLLYRMRDHGGGWNEQAHDIIKTAEYGSSTNRLKKLDGWDNSKRKQIEKVSYLKSGDWHVEGYEPKLDIEDYKEILSEIPRYAIDRGITPEQAYRWKIGFHKNLFPVPRLFFSILDHTGKMVGWSGRAITDGSADACGKYYHLKYFQRDKYLYGEWMVDRKNRTGFLMEGFMDVLNLDKMGLRNCLGTMGISPSPPQIDKLKQWFDNVVIFPHDDEPSKQGVRAGLKMADDYKTALEIVGVNAIIAPIVPKKRLFNEELRNPKDPGEWIKSDLDWIMSMIRRIVIESKKESGSDREEKEEARREEGITDSDEREEARDPEGS